MKIHFITVGKPVLSFAKIGFLEYTKRIQKFHKLKITHLKEKNATKEMLNLMEGKFSVVLDENGREFKSLDLAKFLDTKATQGISEIIFCIGGPDGHSEEIKKESNLLWSLSKLTFPHDLAMLLLAEAIYRASTINVNHPYHRE